MHTPSTPAVDAASCRCLIQNIPCGVQGVVHIAHDIWVEFPRFRALELDEDLHHPTAGDALPYMALYVA